MATRNRGGWGAWGAGGTKRAVTSNDRREAQKLLEESSILWGRDWDAIAFGYVIGACCTLGLRESGVPAAYVVMTVGAIVATWIAVAVRMTRGGHA